PFLILDGKAQHVLLAFYRIIYPVINGIGVYHTLGVWVYPRFFIHLLQHNIGPVKEVSQVSFGIGIELVIVKSPHKNPEVIQPKPLQYQSVSSGISLLPLPCTVQVHHPRSEAERLLCQWILISPDPQLSLAFLDEQ